MGLIMLHPLYRYAIEEIGRQGTYLADPKSFAQATVMTFETPESAYEYLWTRDALVVLGMRVVPITHQGI